MASLPDEALVCRGGSCLARRFASGSGLTLDENGHLQGVSVNCKAGASLAELAKSIPNRMVGVSTVGAIRAAGGAVTPAPNSQKSGALCYGWDHCWAGGGALYIDRSEPKLRAVT